MANNYGVVRTDSIKATKAGNIKSGRFYNGSAYAAIENGNIVKLDSLITGNRELWKVLAPGGVTTPNCYLVASPELIYDESTKAGQALNQFINAANANLTLVPLEVGDTFSISDAAITAINDDDDIVAVGSYVTPDASGTKWKEVTSIVASEKCYGKIIARELYKASTYLNVIEMISVR